MTAPFRILLAVDGSEHSLAAAQLVRALPLPPGSDVMAVAVLTPRHTPGRAALETALEKARDILRGSLANFETGFLHGHPAEALTRFADEHRPDLLIVGAKGLRATLGILLGGVAQQVVEHARWPVLVVRAPYSGLRRALIVVDGSPFSQCALDYIGRFPFPAGVEMQVMHVLPPLPAWNVEAHTWTLVGAEVPPLAAQSLDEEMAARQKETEEEEGRALLDRCVESLKRTGVTATSVLVRGDAATEIIEQARSRPVDVIIAGSRGLSAVTGWWLGSVSRKLVHYADCSALIVRDEIDGEPDQLRSSSA